MENIELRQEIYKLREKRNKLRDIFESADYIVSLRAKKEIKVIDEQLTKLEGK